METILAVMALVFGQGWDAYGLAGVVVLMLVAAAFGRALPAIMLFALGLGVLILPGGSILIVCTAFCVFAYIGYKIIALVAGVGGDHIEVHQYGDGSHTTNIYHQ